jgi:dGTPase
LLVVRREVSLKEPTVGGDVVGVKGSTIREWLEEKEKSLSPYAAKSKNSRGRHKRETPCPVRTEFQRDRDRIIHCKSFRRLKHKTQVFIAPSGDHYVTRLTHTLEVAQVARTIARALNLNEDLTEATALGHDLGHTPFGHVGELVLNELSTSGFRHNEQSLRVVDMLEKDGQGLNLTWEVRDGILKHSKSREDILGKEWGIAETLEGQICKIADIVAYVNHDIGDAIRAGVIAEADLPASALRVLGSTHSERINTMVCDIIYHSASTMEGRKPAIGMSATVQEAASMLREFLFSKVYEPCSQREESQTAKRALRLLHTHFLDHEDELPPEFTVHSDNTEQRVLDYIAGMTDNFALQRAETIQP